MRTIKFRAWDKSAETMNYKGTLGSGSSSDLLSICFDGQVIIQNAFGLDFGARNPAFDPPADNFIIEQFTEIICNKGKEIYEGDIVYKFYGDNTVKERLRGAKGVVEFGRYSVVKDSYGVEYFATGWHMKFLDGSGAIEVTDKFEVIGNIHENPNLLTND